MHKNTFYFTNLFIVLVSCITIGRIYYLQNIKQPFFQELYEEKVDNIVEGYSAPRGRIIDRNGVILVDNYSSNIITYRKLKSIKNEIDIAKNILQYLDYQTIATKDELIDFYINSGQADKYLTDTERQQYSERKLTKEDVYELKKNRITKTDLQIYDQVAQKSISIYYLMNTGYSYETKVIKKDQVTDEECARILEANIEGVTCETSWTRQVVNQELASIYGNVGVVPEENKEYYLNLGYQINDIVGISYLEKQYDEYLKGTKNKYIINEDNTLTLIEKGSRGNDLILSIDINLVKEINQILKDNLLKSTTMRKTDYFNSAYVIVSEPSTGAIISMNGLRILKDNDGYTFKDVTPNIINTSYTVGSVVKGASITVGYLNNLITPGKKINDACVKLQFVPEKCSFKRWGWIDDITALRTSSNYYQFLLAISLTGQKYTYNMELNATEEHFNIYRDTFAKFGLGTLTGIDLPGETIGLRGNIIADDLLLNLAIGQYDNYTPIGLSQYINTIANNGTRIKLSLMHEIRNNNQVLLSNNSDVLSTLPNSGYFSRIKEGLRQVLDGGTGRGYVDTKYNPAGKTGTAETYYDGKITTITQTFAMFAPLDNPKYSIVVVTPNISYNTEGDSDVYNAPINRYIAKSVSKLVFENY